jgi:hypothetical protein
MNVSTRLIVAAAVLCVGCTAQRADPPRIDASSDAAFDVSFGRLVKSLRGYEPRALALGLFGVLLPKECLSPEALIYLMFSPVSPNDAPRIGSCREHLDAMSFRDIMEAAESAKARTSGETA